MAGSPWLECLVAASLLIVCSSHITCFVKPTADALCPADPCHTLSEYGQQPDLYLTSNTTLLLLPGDHVLRVNFTVENVNNFNIQSSLPTENHAVRIMCQESVGFTFRNISHMVMHGLMFDSCGKGAHGHDPYTSNYTKYSTAYGMSIHLGLDVSIVNCSFEDSVGTALGVFYSSLDLRGSNSFTNNCKGCSDEYLGCVCLGSGIYTNNCTLVFAGNNTFRNNSANEYGGGIFAVNSTLNLTDYSTFIDNSAKIGGAIHAINSTVNVTGESTFRNNMAGINGGGIKFLNSNVIFNGNNTFRNNSSQQNGGCVFALLTTLNFTGNTAFDNNINYDHGGGISVWYSTLNMIGNNTFVGNSAEFKGGGIFARHSTLNFAGNNTFRNNSAKYGGGIHAKRSVLSITENEHGEYSGCAFVNNSALIHGGAVYSDSSTLSFRGCNVFSGNLAHYFGGGVYSSNGTLKFSGNTSFSLNKGRLQGGGIYQLGTSTFFSGKTSFTANTAARGAGEYLANSFNFFSRYANLTMDNNNATVYGGAVYVEDSDPTSYCFPDIQDLGRCFFQIYGSLEFSDRFIYANLTKLASVICKHFDIHLYLCNNYAKIAGSAVYGGSIRNCSMEVFYTRGGSFVSSGPHQYLLRLVVEPANSYSSEPYQVYSCNDGILDRETELFRQVYPGELLHFPVVAAGENVPRPAVVQAFFNGTGDNVSLAQFQDTQNVTGNCTELHYQIYSSITKSNRTLVLYADGPCSTDGRVLKIVLEFLSCPPGFSLNSSEMICGCDPRLQRYNAKCNITDRTVTREGDFWVGHDKHSQALIFHPHCPFDYCKPATDRITFPLNNTDLQCNNNRTKILCGDCKAGLSLPLGSSNCLQCSNLHLLLLFPLALAGIALIFLLLICKLTVAVGTINGLIFYANIVAVNRAIFFPPNQTNILTVFIAWVNLDLGVETCFFNGMDEHAKTLLQFAFPLYVWSLLGMTIIVSKYSSRITRLLGSNPVAALVTLFLLSYAKLLRTIISALFFTFLDYPDVQVAVWLCNGNVRYLHGKHIALFIVALLTLLVLFLPYTLFLTLGQWLQAESNRRLFYWVNKPRIKPFLDAYQAPYKDKHRYWTGMLLCLRCVLFLVFAFNIQADPSLNLLAISSAAFGLILVTRYTGAVYKKLYVDILEASYILNLGILAVATYYVKLAVVPASQAAVTYTSVGVAFCTFVGILLYHAYQQVWPKLQQIFHCYKEPRECFEDCNPGQNELWPLTAPTTTLIERPSDRESLINSTQEQLDQLD